MTPGDASWIGLQLSATGKGGIYYNITDGTTRNFTKGHVEGWWEDGSPYNANSMKTFWAVGQPDEAPLTTYSQQQLEWNCDHRANWDWLPRDYNRDRCYADRFQHCARVFPSGSIADCWKCNASLMGTWSDAYVGKWSDDWCYFRQRGYICQRDPKPNPAYYAVEGRCVPSDPSSALLRL